ncbi:glycosyltransferase family 2 protein [Rheinheimera marina]|uniref:Glycosyltransferase family 2 protein n=1 Tax=Rheinheimera marina TaxID=1774958 RepID=A0ABV9JJK5_9GAMM
MPPPLLSLVVPFFNAETWLLPLLQSIDQQLTPEVQLVLVADGPTDGSVALVQGFMEHSGHRPCYLLLQQANAGVSVARNQGIRHAAGSYIGFVDADDLLLPGYIDQVLQAIRSEQPDLIELGYRRFHQPEQLQSSKARYLHRWAGELPAGQALLDVASRNQWFPWLRIYRRQVMPDFQFPPAVGYCEDMMALPALYLACQRVYHLRLPLYGYRVHPASLSFQVNQRHKLQLAHFFSQLQAGLYPDLPERARRLMLLHLAYWLYRWQLQQPAPDAQTAAMASQLQQLARRFCWGRGFSWRKKWQLWHSVAVIQRRFQR